MVDETIHPEQLQLALKRKLASLFGYSFILYDGARTPAEVEHFHRSKSA